MMPPLQNKLFYLLMLVSMSVWSLPEDSQQPIEIEADQAQLDDQKGITRYIGKAVLTQGSLRIEGDIITFYYDTEKQLTKTIAQGKLASYQQIQKPGEEPIHARAVRMEYHAKRQKVYLIGQAYIWQAGDKFSGDRIEYDITKNIVIAKSAPSRSTTTKQKNDRIHIIIQPPGSKKKSQLNKNTAPTITKLPKAITPITTEIASSNGAQNITAITKTQLNLRAGPSSRYSKLGVLKIHQSMIVISQQKYWLQVKSTINGQDTIGWVSRRFVIFN